MSEHVYRGRFAPSPTGALHAGSLVAAMGSYLDARAHNGMWLVRIEDIDPPRDLLWAGEHILHTLHELGLESDEPVLWQHDRYDAYQAALDHLFEQGLAYGCACTRKEIAEAAQARGLPPNVYPGTCRHGHPGRTTRSIRFLTHNRPVTWTDRRYGPQTQRVESEVGDFILKRADGLWAYQLAVVVDDAFQGVTDIVRGADLIDNTARQLLLWEALGVPAPGYLHLPLVLNADGEKLSKQSGARALNPDRLDDEMEAAWQHLGFPHLGADSRQAFWKAAVPIWKARFIDGLPID